MAAGLDDQLARVGKGAGVMADESRGVSAQGNTLASPQVVQEYLQKTKPGDLVTMKVKRAGAIKELTGKALPRQY